MTVITTDPVSTPDPRDLPPALREPRYSIYGALLCHAKNKAGELCRQPAVSGMKVCRNHGGNAPQTRAKARLRLAELVDPAVATLAKEMTTAERSQDRQSAANSILDRAGYARVTKVEGSDARELLVQRLLAMQQEGTDG